MDMEKIKKYIGKIGLVALVCCTMSSCENFLDTTDFTNKNDSNFPRTEADLNTLLTGIYGTMASNVEVGTFQIGSWTSDDQFGGGGMTDMRNHGLTTLLKSTDNMIDNSWSNLYSGIYNTNKLLEIVDDVEFKNESDRSRVKGEAYFMRAFFYGELTKLFGDVPLYTTSEVTNIPRTPAKEVYAVIASDLKKAIELLPSTSFQQTSVSRLVHATRWAAEAYMAREFLFYTGYYKDDSMPLAEGGSISKDNVVDYLNDCINNSGHGLVDDFRSLWFYTNAATGDDYPYNKETQVKWIGEEGANIETIFAVKFNVDGDWGRVFHSNAVSLCNGLRNLDKLSNGFPFGLGWGWSTVNPKMASKWKEEEPNDIRYKASILDVNDPSEGMSNYDEGFDAAWVTDLYAKKYLPVASWKDVDKTVAWPAACELFGAKNDPYFGNMQDLVYMRFADVLLMHSELTQTPEGINRVRKRVNLEPIAGYSFEALEKERHYELAFEGLRYHDVLRWYGPEQAGILLDQNRNGVKVFNAKVPTVVKVNMTKRVKETGGFYQIPQSQIDLSDGMLVQNPGWALPDILFSW